MTTESKVSADQKVEVALELAKREQGVTDRELGTAVGSTAVGAMAAILARQKRKGKLKYNGQVRDERRVYVFDPVGVPVETVRDKSMISVATKDDPLLTLVELASRQKGGTCKEVAKARGTEQFAPFTRTAQRGIKLGIISATGQRRDSSAVYRVVEGLKFLIEEGLDNIKTLKVDSVVIKKAKKAQKEIKKGKTGPSAGEAMEAFIAGLSAVVDVNKTGLTTEKVSNAAGKALGVFLSELSS